MLSKTKKKSLSIVSSEQYPPSLPAVPPRKGVTTPKVVKRDPDRSNLLRRVPSSGSSNSGGSSNNELLDLVGRIKGTLFNPECCPNQKSRLMKMIIGSLNQWDSLKDASLLKLLESLQENVELLDDKMSPLVVALLDSPWTSLSSKMVSSYESFISELLVIRPFYVGAVMQSLIRKFLPAGALNLSNPEEILPSDKIRFLIAHRNLNRVLNAFPRMRESCVKVMSSLYPYIGRDPYIQYCYVRNLILTLDYVNFHAPVLNLIVNKLTRIDMTIPRSELESLVEFTSIVKQEKDEKKVNLHITNPLITTLDICLNLVLKYLSKVHSPTLFESLLSTFQAEVLPCFGVNHVQYVFFYLMGLEPSYANKFLEFLWKIATDFNTPHVLRIQAFSYISGILSRGLFVSVKILKRWLTRISDWANKYVDERVSSTHWSSVNIQIHGPFYAACQTLFYVFAFRNKEILGSRKCSAFTPTLNLGRLVTCDLNPLKASVEPVAVAFVNAAHIHQISYCQTVLERNRKATIPSKSSFTSEPVNSTLESFFPFDPVLLSRTLSWMSPFYREFDPYLPQLKIEKEELDQNEDSIDMELSTSFRDNSFIHFGLLDSNDIKAEDMEQ